MINVAAREILRLVENRIPDNIGPTLMTPDGIFPAGPVMAK